MPGEKNRAWDHSHYRDWIDPEAVVPYENNAKVHTREQVRAIAESIRRYGWQQDVVITADDVLVIGHGRRLAALEIGCEMPYHRVGKNADALTSAEIMALRLVDNMVNESAWDQRAKAEELKALEQELDALGLELDMAAFEIGGGEDWFERRERDGNARQAGNDEYNAFLDKFETPKTTDDCYTPDVVYDAVAGWVAETYGVERERFVRPFYPGGDYQKQQYPAGSVVVDNPPFSLLSEIIRWFNAQRVRFFLFAPGVSLFTAVGEDVEYLPIGVAITYENGAVVNTSFVSNLGEYRIRCEPELYDAVKAANEANLAEQKKSLPKYVYPMEAVTAAQINRLSHYGQAFRVPKAEAFYKNRLDSQKDAGKDAFGGLFLISERAAAERAAAERAAAERAAAERAAAERAAAERAAAERWQLSEDEREIIRGLGQ